MGELSEAAAERTNVQASGRRGSMQGLSDGKRNLVLKGLISWVVTFIRMAGSERHRQKTQCDHCRTTSLTPRSNKVLRSANRTDLDAALDDFLVDDMFATNRYGDISDWCFGPGVTDMSRLFFFPLPRRDFNGNILGCFWCDEHEADVSG